jgi:hypothetical protein
MASSELIGAIAYSACMSSVLFSAVGMLGIWCAIKGYLATDKPESH